MAGFRRAAVPAAGPHGRLRAVEQFTASDGVQIAYEYDDSAPSGLGPVVLLHDFAFDAHRSFGAPGLIDALADADRRTLAIDLRGHGASGTPSDPAFYGEGRMAQDVVELLGDLGIDACDLVGYGMGAIVAILVAAEADATLHVRRAVLGGVGRAAVQQGGIDRTELPPELLIPALQATDPATLTHPFSRAWHAFATTLGADLPALAAQAQAMYAGALPLSAVDAEVLVLVADGDNLAREPELLVEALPSAEQRTLVGADHLTAPAHEEFVPAIVGFLAD